MRWIVSVRLAMSPALCMFLLFCMELIHILLESINFLRPQAAVLVDPIRDTPQFFRNDDTMSFSPMRDGPHKTTFPEDA